MMLSDIARERGIRFFLIAYTDLFGVLRAKLVPARAIDGMAAEGAGFAGYATWFDMSPADPDVLAVPDPSTLIQLPWKPEVGWLAADPWMAGTLLEQAPRNVLRQLVAAGAAKGLEMRTGVEPEFFLITPDGAALADSADTQTKPCYDQLTLMRRFDVIAAISDAMETLGWGPYQNDHEDANGQYEMNWDYAPALITADRHAFFKYMVRTIAEQHGMRATFMPKPFPNLTGSGCHAHVSVWRDGANAFEGEGRPRPVPIGPPVPRRDHGACRGALCAQQPGRQQLQAHQRASDGVRRHVVAQHGELGRQQPHAHGARAGSRAA